MQKTILPATPSDLALIYALFEEAIRFQKANNYIGWKELDKEFVKKDVKQGLLYKVVDGENTLGIFSVCYSDKLIWRDREKEDAIYLHRIVLNRAFQGSKIFDTILAWSIDHADEMKRKFVRMDTWADNFKLINYYKGYGFRFIENYTTQDTAELPLQHRNLRVALLEFDIAL